ncbi:phospholipase D-like protein [Thermosporothrix hazakensis]|jgi:superfamily II DNA or RNA helicase|uniref:Phospholipase D-like protein n=1 Tax=Thermosporothrix hazakensis TaxID=644383 RepID=A0A326TZH8_THEHA|nr:helicase-related protein [Thermosporothrix hazakensis]PZW22866.1 phospholipase D-like protein [Thermosporothrix hazakensis]GCE49834.1 hypothetical protein KTH_47030 [Thermosporothrix hazakensis]
MSPERKQTQPSYESGYLSIPFVIDNQQHTLSDVLNRILSQAQKGFQLDIATAYFNIGGWALLQRNLEAGARSFRLLLGAEPKQGKDIGREDEKAEIVQDLLHELNEASFNERMLQQVEDLTAFLQRSSVEVRLYRQGFLHAKCYLVYGSEGLALLSPQLAIVGSSNFTRAGLQVNKELNLVHRANLVTEDIAPERLPALLRPEEKRQLVETEEESRRIAANVPGLLAMDELAEWYERQWEAAHDFKAELIELLDASKFGRKEYTPYQVYMKALFEYFRDELEAQEGNGKTRSVIELSEFQEDAVRRARKILLRYDGVMIADSVGLGKTWIGKKLLEDYAYHLRYKAVIICPASLKKMWDEETRSAGIAVHILTQEMLGREEYDIQPYLDADLVLIDESHNFRNKSTRRYEKLELLLAGNQRKGAMSGERKKIILLTATPINNSIFDLYHQINLFTGGDRSYFAEAGIGDLQRYFMAAQRHQQKESGLALFNLLEEVVIRRTRPFIKQAYPNATIKGMPIRWPERRLKTVRYNLEGTYEGIYTTIVKHIEGLRLAPYKLETYKKSEVARDQFEEGREEALVGIFKTRYLKRLESSIDAFRISVRRALEFLKTFMSYILEGKVFDSSSFQRALRFLEHEEEEDDALPQSLAEDLDADEEARRFIEQLPTLDPSQYDLKQLYLDVSKDVEALNEIWMHIASITPKRDAKLQRLKDLLKTELKGQKVLLFTYYKDTARYLYRCLTSDDPDMMAWREEAGNPLLKRMDSGNDSRERAKIIAQFAPLVNNRLDIAGSDQEIDILISTDVLSEGQNLQDCGILINYDLHWNPTRMVQRAGRIDRIGTSYETLWIMNMFPDDGLERLLKLVESLSAKIASIDRSGLLDESILGETVHPQNFNTLRRIEQADGRVIEEQENMLELVSGELLLHNLKSLLTDEMRNMLEALPDGIHSGLWRDGHKGVFFYFTAPVRERGSRGGKAVGRQHFWRYVDLASDPRGGVIEDNRYRILNLIQCQPDTGRVVPTHFQVDIFALQEKVISSILQASENQRSIEEAPKILDPMQQKVSAVLRQFANGRDVRRKEVIEAMQKLSKPLPRVYIKELRKALELFKKDRNARALLDVVLKLDIETQAQPKPEKKSPLKREDLKLICYDYVGW